MNLKAFRTLARIIDKEEPTNIKLYSRDSSSLLGIYRREEDKQICEEIITLTKGPTNVRIEYYPEKIIKDFSNRKVKTETLRDYFDVTRTTTDKQRVEIE